MQILFVICSVADEIAVSERRGVEQI